MTIPECLTRRPTRDEAAAAAARLHDIGAMTSPALPVRATAGANIIMTHGDDAAVATARLAVVLAAALLDATERAERAEAEIDALVERAENAERDRSDWEERAGRAEWLVERLRREVTP